MQNKNKLNIISVVMLVLVMIFNFQSNYSYARSYSTGDKQKKLKIVNQKIKNTKNNLDKVKKDKDNVLIQIRNLDLSVDKIQKSITLLNNKIAVSNNNIKKINKKIKLTSDICKKQKKVLYDRLEQIYEGQNENFLDVLLNSKNLNDFFSNVELLNEVVEYDNDILKKYKSTLNEINKDKRKLQKENAVLTSYKKVQQNKISSLQIAMKNKKNLAQQLENKKELYEQSIDDLLKTSAQIEQELQKIQKHSSVKYLSGGFTWPTPGYYAINSPFGYRIHPIFHTRKLHTGLDIGAGFGTPIRATHSGVVAMAGWFGGYGKAVIIDHGGGMASLYGHCSSLVVSIGQRVSTGDIIAYVGSTGNSTGPHLHFEIRINGTPVNPFNYVK